MSSMSAMSRTWLLQLALLRFRATRLGWSGLAGAVLCGAALTYDFTAVRDAERQVISTREHNEVLRQRLGGGVAGAPSAVPRQLEALHAFFPTREALTGALDRIDELAQEQGLTIDSGEYKELINEQRGDGLLRYQLTMPLRGPYPQLRAWLAAVMNEMPAVGLDEFTLKRDRVTNPMVEARLRLTLYFEER